MTTSARAAFAFAHNGQRYVIEPRSDASGDRWVAVARDGSAVDLGVSKAGAKRALIALVEGRAA